MEVVDSQVPGNKTRYGIEVSTYRIEVSEVGYQGTGARAHGDWWGLRRR